MNLLTPIQPPISVLGISPADFKLDEECNQMGSIIMGKTPSDVDIIGISKSIHMKSTENQN
jgi:hypothetical protein